jgi:hypothetical protein
MNRYYYFQDSNSDCLEKSICDKHHFPSGQGETTIHKITK